MADSMPIDSTEVLGREFVLDLLDRLPQAVMILGTDGRVRFWSSGAEGLFGYPRAEMLDTDAERLLPEDRSLAGESARLFAHARAGGELRDFETERLSRAGVRLTVLITQSPMRDHDGVFRGLVQTLTDITAYRRLAGAFERRAHQISIVKEIGEALHSTMDLDEILHLILVGVTAGPGLRFNRAFLLLADEKAKTLTGRLAIGPSDPEEARRIWGRLSRMPTTLRQMLRRYEKSLAEIDVSINRLVQELVLPLDEPGSLITQAIRTGTAMTASAESLAQPDRELASRLGAPTFAAAPLSSKGRTIGIIIADNAFTGREIQADDLEMLQLLAATASVAIDNSRLYAELARRLASLEAARAETRRHQQALLRAERLSAIGATAATVAHEIRNPLVAIGGFARALYRRTDPADPRREQIGIIVDEVARLEAIVTKVLEFARPVTPETRPIEINRILDGVVNLLGHEFEDTRVEVVLELDPDLPPMPADSDRIFEVVLNLVRNAVQAMPDGGKLTIRSALAGGSVELRFSDTGTGIPEPIRDRIFSPFFTTKPSGSGLGLTIVGQIVREHGGTIELQTDEGAGSTFILRLPLAKREANHG